MSTKILQGDCLNILRTLPDESVHCCVTSPPYWGLRDYGTARWEGGDADCDHKKKTLVGNASTLRNDGRTHKGPYDGEKAYTESVTPFKDVCKKCGAIRKDGQLGLEKTPDEYVGKLVEIFHEVRRVLRKDGTCWLNLGDSFFSNGGSRTTCTNTLTGQGNRREAEFDESRKVPHGYKPKDLIGIPWRVALALQADGWWLRQDIIWAKNNPMPESVRDRCTKAHEYIFLLTKSARYFYNAEAIAEPSQNIGETEIKFGGSKYGDNDDPKFATKSGNPYTDNGTRNKRSVWTIATQPYSEAHFATFPEELPRTCILAGCPVGGTVLDPFCGAGTTGLVAKKLGHDFIGIELNPEYVKMAERRIRAIPNSLLAVIS